MSGDRDPVIEVKGVAKSFRVPDARRTTIREHVLSFLRPQATRILPVLSDLDLTLYRGETLGIMGRNGCGKSTLLKIVSGIYLPDAGTVRVHAPITPILELGVGFNPELDAIDNAFLVGTVMGLSLAELRPAMDRIIDFAGLADYAGLPLKHYSSGMAARLAYSVAFEAVREILVLDEVFAVGDAGFKAACRTRLDELRARGLSTLIVSHNGSDIAEFCDRAYLIEQGRVIAEGPALDITSAYEELLRPPVADGAGTP